MRRNAHAITREFEQAVADYTGAPYVVAVNSCTMALTLAVAWHLRIGARFPEGDRQSIGGVELVRGPRIGRPIIEIPSRTYVSVPMAIIHAGGRPAFYEEQWLGAYQLRPLPVWDSARWFSSGMYGTTRIVEGCAHYEATDQIKSRPQTFAERHAMVCTSHHWTKTLGIQQGGCILHDDAEADAWLRRARFDGRTEGVAPKDDNITQIGFHCYLSPEVAAEGLVRLMTLPQHNEPMPNDDYPDLSTLEIFR